MALNDRQQKFVQEYLVDLNATQAATRAGYSAKTAKVHASRLLSNANIQAELQEKRGKLQKKTEITVERIIEQYAKIAFRDIKDFMTWDDGRGFQLRPSDEIDGTLIDGMEEEVKTFHTGEDSHIEQVSRKVKFSDRMKALEMLGRHLGMWKEQKGEGGAGLLRELADAIDASRQSLADNEE